MRCFFDREPVSAEVLLPGNSGNQAKTMTSFTLLTGHYPTVCVKASVCKSVCVQKRLSVKSSVREKLFERYDAKDTMPYNIVLILLFSSACNTSLIYCLVI